MQRRRDQPVVERQHRLQQPGHARGRFEMADIGLDRTDRQRAAPARPEKATDGGRLDRITGRGTGAVHLDKGKILGRDPRPLINRAQQCRLCGFVRQRQADRSSIRIAAAGDDDGANRVAISDRIRQRFQDRHRRPFGPDIAVGARVKGETTAAARQHRGAAKADERVRRQQQVDAADDGAGDAAGADRFASVVQCNKRGGAGGVDRQARAAQIENIGNAVG